MVNRTTTICLAAASLGLAACDTDKYTRPIAHTPHGTAVRANMAAQIINPLPPASGPILTDANRPVQAVGAYRSGEVKDPTEQATAPKPSSVE